MGVSVIRALLILAGVLALFLGLAIMTAGGAAGIGGIWLVGVGAVLLLAVAFERSRYRGEHAERSADVPGPGGGEPIEAHLEPRFRPTDEIFEDPTSHRRMRVWQDPRTGERRYRAEQ